MGSALLFLFDTIIQIIVAVVLVNAVISWLIAFDVLNIRNATVYRLVKFLDSITEPLLRPIRRALPSLGGVDISPLVLWLLLEALSILVHRTIAEPLVATLG